METQNWEKINLIYSGDNIKGFNYAAVPISMFITKDTIRIFFTSRNKLNQSHPFYLDYNLKDGKIVKLINKPLFNVGELGTFDDSGAMPQCVIRKCDKEVWMYYIGWNLGVTVPFRNSIGLAVSYDNGNTFKKKYEGPIMDRTKFEPQFNATPHVIFDENIYKMWYLSCVKWEKINNIIRHYYHIKYAESNDGINWKREKKIAIDFKYKNEYAISVPRVIVENKIYKMWFSYRGGDISEKYRIGYAESKDGVTWVRNDNLVRLEPTQNSWDSDMVCYPDIFEYKNSKYMLYNGNDYGKTGFGLAKLK